MAGPLPGNLLTPTIDAARAWYSDDPVHGFDHVLRVLRLAKKLAEQTGADLEIVHAAALLHDAQPPYSGEQPDDEMLRVRHQHASADFAGQVLSNLGWVPERIEAVKHCIRAHRFRDDREQPRSLEAQVLFDADKLDAIGAIGVVRALGYAQAHHAPAYAPPSALFLETGELEEGELHSAYHEYLFKLQKLHERLYTPYARQLGEARHRLMQVFFDALEAEQDGTG